MAPAAVAVPAIASVVSSVASPMISAAMAPKPQGAPQTKTSMPISSSGNLNSSMPGGLNFNKQSLSPSPQSLAMDQLRKGYQ